MIKDPDEILKQVVRQVRLLVGDNLSTLPNTTFHSVIQDIQGGPRPDFPYIVANYTLQDTITPTKDRGATEDGEAAYITITENITYTLTCYGDRGSAILKELKHKLEQDLLRSAFDEATTSTLVTTSSISRSPIYLSTEFINTAVMDINLATVSYILDTDTGLIDTVNGYASYIEPNVEGNLTNDAFSISAS